MKRVLVLVLTVSFISCGSIKPTGKGTASAYSQQQKRLAGTSYLTLVSNLNRQLLANSNNLNRELNSRPKIVSHESLKSLSLCRCTPLQDHKFLQTIATMPGAMPQEMVPEIKKNVRENDSVKKLQNLGGVLGDILKQVFATDEKVAETIREEIVSNLESALGKQISSRFLRNNINFDAFRNLPETDNDITTDGIASPQSQRVVKLKNQFALWRFSWGQQGFGKTDSQIQDKDLVQLYHGFSSLIEWSYAMGIGRPLQQGKSVGGLTFEILDFNNLSNSRQVQEITSFAPYDPRINGQPVRYMGGELQIDFPVYSRLDTILHSEESWKTLTKETSLKEQVVLWEAAAKALSSLRPRNLAPETNKLIGGESGVLPDNVHQIALSVLPTMNEMLSKHFINPEERSIHEKLKKGPSDNSESSERASLESVTGLLASMYLWNKELLQIDDLGLSPDLQQQLKEAPKTFTRTMRLIVQNLLGTYSRRLEGTGIRTSILLEADGSDSTNIYAISKAIYFLTKVEQDFLSSDYLKSRIKEMNRWLIQSYLIPVVSGTRSSTPWEIISAYAAFDLTSNQDILGSQTSNELSEISKNLKNAIVKWEIQP